MSLYPMSFLRYLGLCLCITAMVVNILSSVESAFLVRFDRAPPVRTRFSIAVFQYSVKRPDGSNACKNYGCSITCELDGQTLRPCPADSIVLKNLTVNRKHNLFLNVTTQDGERNSSTYSWFVDTIPPTATIFSEQNHTNAEKIVIDVTFSEACRGHGGFKCVNSSNCDVIINGPAHIDVSSLHIIKPGIKYSLGVNLSLSSTYGRVVINMADKFCTDLAGNPFTRTNGSTLIVHFDRRPVLVDLWTSVPSYELGINGVPRTVLATNNLEDLEIFLDFSIPVINSSEQILKAFHVNSGNLLPVHAGSHGSRSFVFELRNISRTEIITIELKAGLLLGRTGTPVSPVASLAFLYDSTKPGIGLSTSSPRITKEPNINVIVEFTKPVFGFEASMVNVDGGRLTRFTEHSKSLYSLTVLAVTSNVVTVIIPAGKVNDVSGNLNLASNQLEVKHYSTPAISIALHSFVTVGILSTSLAASVLSISFATLEAIGTIASGSTSNVASGPSMNLHGMIGHLQVFVFSDWLSVNQPIEYSETIKGLRWLIPRQKLPWKKDNASIWTNHVYLAEGKLTRRFSNLSFRFFAHGQACHKNDSNLTGSIYMQCEQPHTKYGWYNGQHSISVKDTPYGLPLNSSEYFIYFLRGEPLSASNVVKRIENYKGWQDLEMNLFWLGVGGGSLVTIHVLILLFLRWRTGTPVHGILSVPRFELFLLILILPSISQSSAFAIRGGTTGGIITGAFLLTIPTALILSVCLFLIIAIFSSSFARYKEVKHVATNELWYAKLWFFFIGRPTTGKWFYREGLPASFLLRFGMLFESQKGPPYFVVVDQNEPNTVPKRIESGQSGIGRIRAVGSDDSNEEIKIPIFRRILGCARSSYVILDLLRRVIFGIISGAYTSKRWSQSLTIALTVTLAQFVCLFALKPYIRRRVQVVESVSLLCEAGIFGLYISINNSSSTKGKNPGYAMLALLFLTFVSQIINEWYAMIRSISRLSQSNNNSLKLGLKVAAKGLVLPFLPRAHWSRVIPGSSRPEVGLAPVLPLSPEIEFERGDARTRRVEPLSAMTATVVPVLTPGSPGLSVAAARTTVGGQRAGDGKRQKGVKSEPKSELKMLRELAKASFSGHSKDDDEGSSSYTFRMQSLSGEASTSKMKH